MFYSSLFKNYSGLLSVSNKELREFCLSLFQMSKEHYHWMPLRAYNFCSERKSGHFVFLEQVLRRL